MKARENPGKARFDWGLNPGQEDHALAHGKSSRGLAGVRRKGCLGLQV